MKQNDTKKTTQRRNSKKYSSKSNRGVKRAPREQEVGTGAQESTRNDVAWYARYPHILEEATRLPFAYPIGQYYDTGYSVASATEWSEYVDTSLTVPGVMCVNFTPTPGESYNKNSPINIAAQNVYTYVRHMNSGHANYEQADLMMYLLAMDSLYIFHSYVRKILAISKLYTPVNKYFPRALLVALGVDPEDVFANQAQWEYFVNMVAYRAGAFAAPASMTFYERHAWMSNGLYVDQDVTRAQIYMFKPTMLWKYENLGTTGTKLVPLMMPKAGDNKKLVDFQVLFNNLISTMLGDEDFGIMSGDVFKAFGADGLVKLLAVDSTTMTLPTYDPLILAQIHNARAVGAPILESSTLTGFAGRQWQITQNPDVNNGAIIFHPTFGYDGQDHEDISFRAMCSNMILNLPGEVHTAEMIIEATRLATMFQVKAVPTGETSKPVLYLPNGFGTEVVNDYTMISVAKTAPHDLTIHTFFNNILVPNAKENYVANLELLNNIIQFDWAPQLYLTYGVAQESFGPFAQLNDWTILTGETLARMHEVCVTSMFDVPQMGFNK